MNEPTNEQEHDLLELNYRHESIGDRCKEMAECIFREVCSKALAVKSLQDLPLGMKLEDSLPSEDIAKTCKKMSEAFFADELGSLMASIERAEELEFAREIATTK